MDAYSIGEISKLLNLSISTLRYYDKEGLLDNVERSKSGIRIFHDSDIRQLRMLECLKGSGMSLKDIKLFFKWCREGDSTIEKRHEMFVKRKKELQIQMKDLQNTLDMISYKCEYYRIAMKHGNTDNDEIRELQHNAETNSDFIKTITGTPDDK